MAWEEAGLVSNDVVIESEQLGSVFAVTKRPNEKVVGIHAVRKSAEIQRDAYNKEFPSEEYGVIEWLIRDDIR